MLNKRITAMGLPWILPVMTALAVISGLALASDISDHERARAALESGDVVPLAVILEEVESLYEGSIIEVELEEEDDDYHEYGGKRGDQSYISGFIYEIKLLTPQGNLLKLEMDARTAELIRVRGQGEKLARKKIRQPEREQEP